MQGRFRGRFLDGIRKVAEKLGQMLSSELDGCSGRCQTLPKTFCSTGLARASKSGSLHRVRLSATLRVWEKSFLGTFSFLESISLPLGYRTLCSTLSIVICVRFLLSLCPTVALENCCSPDSSQRCVVPEKMRVGFNDVEFGMRPASVVCGGAKGVWYVE